MAGGIDTGEHVALRLELQHLRERLDEGQARQDKTIDTHGSDIAALKAIVERFRGAWLFIGGVAGAAAAVGAYVASWIGHRGG